MSVERGSKIMPTILNSRFCRAFEDLGQQRFKADSVLVTIAGHKVGFIGLAGAEGVGQADVYTQGALALRRQGAAIVIAMVGLGGAEGEGLAAEINGVDIIVIGGKMRCICLKSSVILWLWRRETEVRGSGS